MAAIEPNTMLESSITAFGGLITERLGNPADLGSDIFFYIVVTQHPDLYCLASL